MLLMFYVRASLSLSTQLAHYERMMYTLITQLFNLYVSLMSNSPMYRNAMALNSTHKSSRQLTIRELVGRDSESDADNKTFHHVFCDQLAEQI